MPDERALQEKKLSFMIVNISSGILLGLLIILDTTALASLVFHGTLLVYLPAALCLSLLVTIFLTGLRLLLAGSPYIIGNVQEAYFVMIAALTVSLAQEASQSLISIHTTLALMMLCTFMIGCILYMAGRYRLYKFLQFIPYPVVVGYLAGLGGLILLGTINILTGVNITEGGNLGSLFTPKELALWLPAFAYTLLMVLLARKFPDKKWLFPAMILLAIFIFYCLLFVLDLPIDKARHANLMFNLEHFSGLNVFYHPFFAKSYIDWPFVLQHLYDVVAIVLVNFLGVFVHLNALETELSTTLDMRLEMRSYGLANLLFGLLAAPAGYHSVGLTALNHTFGGRHLVSIITLLVVALLGIFYGSYIILLVPKSVFAILLFFISINWLASYLIQSRKKLPLLEYLIVMIIFLSMLLLSFYWAVIFGILLSVLIFGYQYSRISVIHSELQGEQVRSTVKYHPIHARFLEKKRHQLVLIKLQGYLFFGNTAELTAKALSYIKTVDFAEEAFILFDFSLVKGIDYSAIHAFVRLNQQVKKTKVQVILCNLAEKMLASFTQAYRQAEMAQDFIHYAKLDYAIEWSEKKLLNHAPSLPQTESVHVQLRNLFSESLANALIPYLTARHYCPGEIIYRQGEQTTGIDFIISGAVEILLETKLQTVRLGKFYSGNMIGEMGVYLQENRSATVKCIEPALLYTLSKEQFREMNQKEPKLAALFHFTLAKILSERLKSTNRFISSSLF
ncbi:SulP family inorganic anion transporter [Legionella londiniensis]|uniref:Sulfate transporter n=1 Tax=Legionella londiniensis TaxID=45068 RepID=A0A0W0VQY4_9GAMM|nr:SulP family inorganic anion transporter [Legionella londiniensis]KTD22583.1 sulfate transporter [Legionella londiniensis]STX92514.1 sulfate transporter [Legionella londiniensis]